MTGMNPMMGRGGMEPKSRGKENTIANSPNRPGSTIDAIYADPKDQEVSVDQFLNLMVTQLQNQDFMNPMDDTQYVTQLAQFATMQYMQQLAYHSESNYAMGLVGKEVTVARLKIGGDVEKITGPVEKIMMTDKEFKIFVKGQAFTVGQIMEVHSGKPSGKPESSGTEKFVVVPTEKTQNSIKITWPKFTEDEQNLSNAKYSVYYSKGNQMDTVAEVKKGTLVGTPERGDLYQETITGLDPDTTYYVNVLVKHGDGSESIYQKTITTTEKKIK